MKNKRFFAAVSLLLSLIMVFGCFSASAAAVTPPVKVKPTRTTFYQGIDWMYTSGTTITTIGNLDISGMVITYGDREINYQTSMFGANMYAKAPTGGWKAGVNQAKVYCTDFSSSSEYVTVSLTLATVESIKIRKTPDKTILVEGEDWKRSVINDVEMTKYDITGAQLDVTYSDSAVKTVSYPENSRVGWSVPDGVDSIKPGDATLNLTFCGKSAPFTVSFVSGSSFAAGDVSLDNKITSYDALLILRYSTGSASLSDLQKSLADVTSDKLINSSDALIILQYIVGIRTSIK